MNDLNFDTNAYLERIGCPSPVPVTLEGLKMLTRAHLCSVPFENLLLTEEGAQPSLEGEDLYRKIVEHKRGGYCFELNKVFQLLLEALGFECRGVAARILNNRPEPRPISHRAVVVVIDGKRYFCDVGFGGAGPKGVLPLDDGLVQTVSGDQFFLSIESDGIVISAPQEDGLLRIMKFTDQPWLDVDFNVLNCYYATYPNSVFRIKRVLYLCTEDGWISLTQNTFTRCAGGVKTVTELADDQVPDLIRREFHLNVPLKDHR